MAAVLGRVAVVLGLAAVIAVPRASAQFDSPVITDEEANAYFAILGRALDDCEIEWFEGQLAQGTAIEFVHADGSLEVLSGPDYAKAIERLCLPYKHKSIRWDRQSRQVSTVGYTTTLKWQLAWGGYEPGQEGSTKVIFSDWANLLKYGQRIYIAGIGETVQELVPGSEEEFNIKMSEGVIGYKLRQVFAFLRSGYGNIKHRLREWSRKRRGTASRNDVY